MQDEVRIGRVSISTHRASELKTDAVNVRVEMSEYIAVMTSSAGQVEYDSKRVLAGDVEVIRQRFTSALERLGYDVISEQPLVAKNNARQGGLASANCMQGVLRSPIKLTIGLRPFNETSTLATFDYSIKNSMVTKGDRQTLEREIEALMALATARPQATVCAVCGTSLTNDSRFCRACGAPNSSDEPAELEVLRLTADARAAYQNIVGSVISILTVLAVALPIIFLSRKGPKPGTIFLIISELFAFCWLLYGMWMLHRTLNAPAGKRQKSLSSGAAQGHVAAAVAPETAALALPPAQASVTEGTTELLTPPERVAVPVNRQSRDTGPIN